MRVGGNAKLPYKWITGSCWCCCYCCWEKGWQNATISSSSNGSSTSSGICTHSCQKELAVGSGSWKWQPGKQATRQPQNVFPICQTEIIFLLQLQPAATSSLSPSSHTLAATPYRPSSLPYRHAHASVAAVLISCLAAASLCHISNTFTVNSKGIMRLLSFLFLLQLFLLLPFPHLHRKPSVCFAAAEIAAVSDSQQITGSAKEHECDYEYECECECEQKYL